MRADSRCQGNALNGASRRMLTGITKHSGCFCHMQGAASPAGSRTRCSWVRMIPVPRQVEAGVKGEAAPGFRHLDSPLYHLGVSPDYWTLLTLSVFNLGLLLERKTRCRGKVFQTASLEWYGNNIFSRKPVAAVVPQTLKSKMKSWRREEK